jgi:hypothetical protein
MKIDKEIKRVYKIERLRRLTDFDLIKLIEGGETLDNIAKSLDVTRSQLSLEITNRDLYKVKGDRRTRKVNFKPAKKVYQIDEDEIHSVNSWMNSKERSSFVNAGLMQNKSLKYI